MKVPDVDGLLETLASRLVIATKQGSVKWDDTSTTSFQCELGPTTVVVRSKDGDGVRPFEMRLVNFGGVVVDSVATSMIDDPEAWDGRVIHESRLSALVEELYEAARRNALEVDTVIADALEALSATGARPEDDII